MPKQPLDMTQPFNMTMHDGSRHFYGHPTVISWDVLIDHLETLPDLKITNIVSDFVTETWVDFTFRSQKVSINDQHGDFWFFAEDPGCPEEILQEIVTHCMQLPSADQPKINK